MYEIFGRSHVDGPVGGRQFVAEYLHPADVPEVHAAFKRAMRTGSFQATCRIRREGGARRWLQIDGRLEKATRGKPARLVGVVADVTTRKRLEARAQELSHRLLTVQEEERRNIAQELHDSTVQHLVAASLLMTSLKNKSRREDRPLWDEVEVSLGEAMKELRTFSYLMHPPTLRAQGLRVSLQRYVDGLAERSGLAITLRIGSLPEKLPLHIERAIFRIVQEGLANVHRHASASRASVELRCIAARVHVIITDDGRGIDAKALSGRRGGPPHPGVGIRGMAIRLNQLGGRLKLSQVPAGGTRLHVVLPVTGRVR
jgi:PAS domain S-box-containing protein